MVSVPRELLERLADHAAALSHSDTTDEQRQSARSDAEESDSVLSFAALAALTPPAPAEAELERLSAAVHADWMAEQAARGRTSSIGRDGEEYMVPYEQLSEAAKELDRVTVRAVLKHLKDTP